MKKVTVDQLPIKDDKNQVLIDTMVIERLTMLVCKILTLGKNIDNDLVGSESV